jgi:hypothetical protein
MQNECRYEERILSKPYLLAAWQDVQWKKGLLGLDEITLSRWGWNWDVKKERQIKQVSAKTYHPNRQNGSW